MSTLLKLCVMSVGLAAAATLAGCLTHTQARPVGLPVTRTLAPTCWQGVSVYYSPPAEPYVELALLHNNGNAFATRNAVLKGMRQKAAKLGATGILYGSFVYGAADLLSGPEGEGRAIYVPSDTARVRIICESCEARGMRTSWGTQNGERVSRCVRDG